MRKIIIVEPKKIEKFSKEEWKIFDKEIGQIYDTKKFSIAAYEKEMIVGIANLKISGGTAYLSELLVSKQHRGKGIGKDLISKFEKIARKEKCHRAFLQTSDTHSKALNFYKKNGYKIIAKLPNHKFHSTWYILSKELKK